MKYVVISDIHGVIEYSDKIEEIITREKPNKIILLGDLYHHGFNIDFDFMHTVNILNKYVDKIICVRGNCDNDVDELVSKFRFNDFIILDINNKKFFFTHGHLYDIYSIPNDIDVFIYGHLHTHFIKNINNKLCINVGSLSLPRNNTLHSYAVIENNKIFIKDIDNNVIDSIKYTTEV